MIMTAANIYWALCTRGGAKWFVFIILFDTENNYYKKFSFFAY